MLHCAHLAHRINTDKRTHHTTPQQQPTWHILHDKVDALLILAAAVHAHQQRVVQQAQDVALAAQVGDLRCEGVAGEGGRGKGELGGRETPPGFSLVGAVREAGTKLVGSRISVQSANKFLKTGVSAFCTTRVTCDTITPQHKINPCAPNQTK